MSRQITSPRRASRLRNASWELSSLVPDPVRRPPFHSPPPFATSASFLSSNGLKTTMINCSSQLRRTSLAVSSRQYTTTPMGRQEAHEHVSAQQKTGLFPSYRARRLLVQQLRSNCDGSITGRRPQVDDYTQAIYVSAAIGT